LGSAENAVSFPYQRTMNLFTVTIGVSILIYAVVGSYAGRSVRQLDDYFVAGRRAPTLLILGILVASVMSTSIFMGEAAFTYNGKFGALMKVQI